MPTSSVRRSSASQPATAELVAGLPASERVLRGLRELELGAPDVDGLLVAIGATRIRACGIPVPEHQLPDFGEMLLYQLLCERGEADPYSRYNALLRELVSFERALEQRVRQRAQQRASD